MTGKEGDGPLKDLNITLVRQEASGRFCVKER